MFIVTIGPSAARGSLMIYFILTQIESAMDSTRQLTGDLPYKLGKNSEVMNCAPSVGTINLVMNNTL